MDVVVVESPAKAKTINKYLGNGFKVVASYGHVRDLEAKDGSVRPDEDFAMSWRVDEKSEKHIAEIRKAIKGAENLYLATDPDREGEAISWHVLEVLRQRKALENIKVRRVVFHEITKRAVLHAVANPRDVNKELVDAYLARRALDYLVGFTLSPVLWRKLPGSRSAGRVQSVALRLICEREAEIEIFKKDEFWTVDTAFTTADGAPFTARLTHLDGRKLDKLELGDEAAAKAAVSAIENKQYRIASIERKQTRRNPYAPFTTSTLQQEASRKLRMGTSRTMQVAQKLYEGFDIDGETVGLITYMRTDSVTLSQEAVAACRSLIERDFGKNYLPDKPRLYKTKAKNAQEAHEAIRPTDLFRRPADVRHVLDDDQFRLYELVWKRTVASGMESAVLDQVAIDITPPDDSVTLRANGSVVAFDGFLKLYREDRDDAAADDNGERRLPQMTEGEQPALGAVTPEQHFTQPPPRYGEASLVKQMEELGIGRPSTYASIVKVLQDRDYVRLEKRRFQPEDKGRLVVAFLTGFFPRYVEYGFTAGMEEKLDDISGGRVDWKTVLREFWEDFSVSIDGAKDLSVSQVLEILDRDLGPHFFPAADGGDQEAARLCPSCKEGRLNLKLGKFGAFVGCARYPECSFTRPLVIEPENGDGNGADAGDYPRELGTDPASRLMVSLRKGPYGIYVQLGETPMANGEDKPARGKKKKAADKPKRVSLPKGLPPAEIDFDKALALLALPRDIGAHPESGQNIAAGLGRYGPYLKHGPAYISLTGDDDVLSIGLNRAVVVIAEAGARGSRNGGRELGVHPSDDKKITVGKGRFGPYVRHGKTFASLPRDASMDDITLEQAVELIDAKLAKAGTAKKPAARKPAKKKAKKTAKKTK